MMALGNTTLVEHGIQTEQSDIRAHVCVNAGLVCVFPTRLTVEYLTGSSYQPKPVYSYINGQKILTARGYAVPYRNLPKITPIPAKALIQDAAFSEDDSTSDKGDKAVWVVQKLLLHGWFPLRIDPQIITDVDMQRKGMDIIVKARHRIEVKCDYRGGGEPDYPRTTGNLFLQIAECNPLGMT